MPPATETNYIFEVQLRFDKSLRSKLVKLHNLITQSNNSDYEPHITLLKAKVSSQIQNFPDSVPVESVFPISLCGFGYMDNYFLLGVNPNLDLFKFHRSMCDALTRDYAATKGLEIIEEYRPGKWVPCFKLVDPLPVDQLYHALEVVMDLHKSSLKGTLKSFGLHAAFPVSDIGKEST